MGIKVAKLHDDEGNGESEQQVKGSVEPGREGGKGSDRTRETISMEIPAVAAKLLNGANERGQVQLKERQEGRVRKHERGADRN